MTDPNNNNSLNDTQMHNAVDNLANMEQRERLLKILEYEEYFLNHSFYSFLYDGQLGGQESFKKVYKSVNLLLIIKNHTVETQTDIAHISSNKLLDYLESLNEYERIVQIVKYSNKISSTEFLEFCQRFFNEQMLGRDIVNKRTEKYAKVLDTIDTFIVIKLQITQKQRRAQRNETLKNAALCIGAGIVGVGLLSMIGNAANYSSRQRKRSSSRGGYIGTGTNYTLTCSQCGATAISGGICSYCHSNQISQEQERQDDDWQNYIQQQQDIHRDFQEYTAYQQNIDYYNTQDFYSSQDY